MCCTNSCFGPQNLVLYLQLFGLAVMAILFLQSGLDKITDWKGNLGWLKGHFANSPFKNIVPLILGILTVQEVLTGVLCLAGGIIMLVNGQKDIAVIGLLIGLSSFLALFLGQRMAKDYPGAASLVPYMLLNAFLLYLFI